MTDTQILTDQQYDNDISNQQDRSVELRAARVVAALKRGKTIRESLESAGYSAATAKGGRRALSMHVFRQLSATNRGLEVIGELYTPSQRATIVRGKLLENVALGKDQATKSLELLGKDSQVGMFKNDSSAVGIQINIPKGMEALFGSGTGNLT